MLCVCQVPATDNYFAALNSAVFSDGSFVYVPKGVVSPMEVSTYFRINAEDTGQVLSLQAHVEENLFDLCLDVISMLLEVVNLII